MRRIAALLPLLILAALLVAVPAEAAGRTYPLHTKIVTTTFWVGELFNATAADGSQVCSTYDSQWAKRWSGKDNGSRAAAGTDCEGAPLGGCDGKPSGSGASFKCATERRTAANGFYPTDPSVTPLENPFYLDLPFDDLNNAAAFKARGTVVPWANDPGYAGQARNTSFSFMKNRWVQISRAGQVCYGQIQDAGPGKYNDQAYVFGNTDARPQNRQYGSAGMDVSPALTGCLNLPSLDGISPADISWRFVEAADVPAGPWTRVITTSQVDGAKGSPEYIASITPSRTAPTTSVPATTTAPTSTSAPACG